MAPSLYEQARLAASFTLRPVGQARKYYVVFDEGPWQGIYWDWARLSPLVKRYKFAFQSFEPGQWKEAVLAYNNSRNTSAMIKLIDGLDTLAIHDGSPPQPRAATADAPSTGAVRTGLGSTSQGRHAQQQPSTSAAPVVTTPVAADASRGGRPRRGWKFLAVKVGANAGIFTDESNYAHLCEGTLYVFYK
ncbi:hypothetical protein BC834DRAFT_974114 [Gloeopeniophorella convolvens]|nr:hypothetical protein BC834DRAFT_974114 [Gloeopeniophorella convolvens]